MLNPRPDPLTDILRMVRFPYHLEIAVTSNISLSLIKILTEVQELSGRPLCLMNNATKPIGDLDGFDSLSSIEATVMLESALGINADCDSLFISEDGAKALTIEEIVARISLLVEPQEASA
jgi:hypothetical protein